MMNLFCFFFWQLLENLYDEPLLQDITKSIDCKVYWHGSFGSTSRVKISSHGGGYAEKGDHLTRHQHALYAIKNTKKHMASVW